MRVYIYVDGESHFIRSEKAWQEIHGQDASLEHARPNSHVLVSHCIFSPATVFADDHYRLFFDAHSIFSNIYHLPRLRGPGYGVLPATMHRAVYFTSISGDSPELHRAQAALRNHGFEPWVKHEKRALKQQRDAALEKEGIIEKAKGVDIALATRMLEDAYQNNFDACMLFTSDVDFLPAIEVVRRLGKEVYVYGHRAGLGRDSPFEHAPDAFIDVGKDFMAEAYKYCPPTR
jgi:uncharacterized LabA/DUF88 family protein